MRSIKRKVKGKPRPFVEYTTYRFKTYDPIIDRVQEHVDGMKLSQISEASKVSATTMRAWFTRKTKRPKFCTVAAVLGAVGARLEVVRDD